MRMNTDLYRKYYNKIRQTDVPERFLSVGKIDDHTFDLSLLASVQEDSFLAFLTGQSDCFQCVLRQTEKEKLKKMQEQTDIFLQEKGKNNLFIGYPFWSGKGERSFRAPMLFQAVHLTFLSENRIKITKTEEHNRLNLPLFIHYCLSCDIDCPFLKEGFFGSSLPYEQAESYLQERGIAVKTENGFRTFRENFESETPTLSQEVILGHFSPAFDYADDYRFLLKNPSPSSALSALTKGEKRKFFPSLFHQELYPILSTDPSQEEAMRQANKGRNLFLFGPPGTGKSQTIANLVAHFLYKGKKILVVSQNKYAQQVLTNRLSSVGDLVLSVGESASEKCEIFRRANLCHQRAVSCTDKQNKGELKAVNQKTKELFSSFSETEKFYLLKSDIDLSIREMMENSTNMEENEKDKEIYDRFNQNGILDFEYAELKDLLEKITRGELLSAYCAFQTLKNKYKFLDFFKDNLDPVTLKKARLAINALRKNPPEAIDLSLYPLAPFLSNFAKKKDSVRKILPLARKVERCAGQPHRSGKELLSDLFATRKAVLAYFDYFDFLKGILSHNGYQYLFSARNVPAVLSDLSEALKAYPSFQINKDMIDGLDEKTLRILNQCFRYSEATKKDATPMLTKLLSCKLYKEIKENVHQNFFSDHDFFENRRKKYNSLQAERQQIISRSVVLKRRKKYADYFKRHNCADYLFAIQNGTSVTSLRAFFQENQDFLFRLFPCILTDPKTVSAVFPMKKELFDLIIFDEAGQIPTETAIPCLYRAKKVIVAGDDKQMPPSDLFRCRIHDENSVTSARSLLEPASARLFSVPLRYHYRSKSNDLIAFSNKYFYQDSLLVAPDNIPSLHTPSIERIKVDGIRENRHNDKEAQTIVEILKRTFSDCPQKSVGVVLFNVEQKLYLEKLIEKECRTDSTFSAQIRERPSFFIRNIDNIQGDERDIIILGTGYAKEKGEETVRLLFGSLSQEGGERRLNVAVTRAKEKIILVTSFEPEELSDVESCKFLGPKLFQKYLHYAREVANGSSPVTTFSEPIPPLLQEVKKYLEKKGYPCESISCSDFTLPLVAQNKEGTRFLLGIVLDNGEQTSANEHIFRTNFLEKKGWKIMHLGTSDLWKGKERLFSEILDAVKQEEKTL